MKDFERSRLGAQKALLDMFSQATGLPIGLYETHNNEIKEIITDFSRGNFADFCRLIQQFPGGKELCEADQCHRARNAFEISEPELMLCHAGLYNQAVPVQVRGETRAVLVYGEIRIDQDEHRSKAIDQLEHAIKAFDLDAGQADELRQAYAKTRKYDFEQLETLDSLIDVQRWFYRLHDEEDRMKSNVDRITHEIQIRLQAVIANSENLMLEVASLPEEARHMVSDVLNSALALDMVIQNLGLYLGEYEFRRQRFSPLIYEAKRIYEAEAARRGIDIQVRIGNIKDVHLIISKTHMQHAFNNLIHNAVKYSFRGGYGRQRFVDVKGYVDPDTCRLEISNYGVGIKPHEIEEGKIFEDGYQGELTEGEFRTGAGKGLSLVKRIIDRHGGRIAVESKMVADASDPEGQPHLTRFTIFLPRQKTEEQK